MVAEEPVCPAADDDYLRKPGIEGFDQPGQALKIRILDLVAYGGHSIEVNGAAENLEPGRE